MNFRPHRQEPPELNLIPMIDVLIVLLIFLVLTTTFSHEAGLQITLPEAAATSSPEERGIEVEIDASGGYLVDRKRPGAADLNGLKQALREAAAGRSEARVIVRADEQATHQSVMTVLDAAGQLGIVRIRFATRLPPAVP